MNSIYSNNQEVTTFITKAQNKIADLSTLLVERAGDISPLDILALELIDFIEALDNPLTDWTLDEVLRWIHEYNHRANLGELSYLNLYGYNTTLINNIVGTSSITTSSITDFEVEVNNLIRRFPHNSLAQIQGGTTNERYHLTKEMYDYLSSLLNPVSPSNVSLTLTTNGRIYPSGYYELGSSISVINLVGTINYGSSKKAVYFEYLKNGVTLGSRTNNPLPSTQPNATSDTSGVREDTTYTFSAAFDDGVKNDNKTVRFKQPMYYGITRQTDGPNIQSLVINGTKDVRDKGQIDLTFNVPVGNTSLNYGESQTPFFLYPADWGNFTSAINATFEFVRDWRFTFVDMPLADGTTKSAILGMYRPQIEGTSTFRFNW